VIAIKPVASLIFVMANQQFDLQALFFAFLCDSDMLIISS